MDSDTNGIVITIALFFINIFLLSSAMKMYSIGLINVFGVGMFVLVSLTITFVLVLLKTKICEDS